MKPPRLSACAPRLALFLGLALLLLGLGVGAAQAALLPAGQIVFVKGEAWRTGADGAREALVPGSAVYPGDTLDTAIGVVHVRFTDQGLIALTTSTRLVIDEYVYRGKAKGRNKGFFSLVAGGVRAITGLIGKKRHMDYRLYASAAFIGIRGTAYQARLCQGDCPVVDGLYANDFQGLIAVTNDAGELILGPGMSTYVRDFRTAPVPIDSFPVPVDVTLANPPGGAAAPNDSDAEAASDALEALGTAVQMMGTIQQIMGGGGGHQPPPSPHQHPE
jgi:hypothetical protein